MRALKKPRPKRRRQAARTTPSPGCVSCGLTNEQLGQAANGSRSPTRFKAILRRTKNCREPWCCYKVSMLLERIAHRL